MDGSAFIRVYDPSLPPSATNPSNTNIPTLTNGGGLTLMSNINGGTVCPTFYSVAGGNYFYWNGVSWVNTGHTTGNGAAVNLAGCGTTIYNLVGGTGQIYSYNGTANGTLLTTITGFNGGGPYDLVTDCNCNFYVLKTSTPNQNLTLYSPLGAVISTWTLVGMPNSSAGGGFAIIGNSIYVRNGNFYAGTISGPSVTFSVVNGFTANAGDFASCPVCNNVVPQQTLNASISPGGQLSCNTNTLSIAVTSTVNPINYSWSGPGIVGAVNGASITVNAAGVYTCLISSLGCPSSQLVLTSTISTNISTVNAVITPSGNVCTNLTGFIQFQASPIGGANSIQWFGPGIIAGATGSTISTSAVGIYSLIVTNAINGCFGTQTVAVHQTPTVSIALTNNTLCSFSSNGSISSLTISPSGALNYNLTTSLNYTANGANPINWPISGVSTNTPTQVNIVVNGTSGYCSSSAFSSYTIIPNPNLILSPVFSSICIGNSQTYSVSGAQTYTWSGSQSLNSYSTNIVNANPIITSFYSVIGSNYGCNSITQNSTLTVVPLPNVSISPLTSTICLGTASSLTVTGNSNVFSWSPPNGLNTTTTAVVNASPNSSQVYTLIGSLNSCTSSATSTVYVVNPPVLSLALSSNTICEYNYYGSLNSLTASPSGANSYTLLNGTNFVVTNLFNSFQINPIASQQNIVSIGVATLIGVTSVCTASILQTFSILPNPILNISPSSASICPLQNQIFNVNGASTYSWLPSNDLNTLNGNIVLSNPINSNIYSVIGTSVGCNSTLHSAQLTVKPIPSVSVSPQTASICFGNSIQLVASGNGSNYSWSPSIGLNTVIGQSVIANPLIVQNYTVLSTLNSCTNSAIASVSVIALPVPIVIASQYTVCTGSTTQLSASGAISFNWIPSQTLNYASGNSVLAFPYSNTIYTVHANNGLCVASTTIQIKTIPYPNMTINATANQICSGSTVSLYANGAQTYSWYPNSGLTNPYGSQILAAPIVNTNYTVVGSNSNGTISCYQQMSYSVITISKVQGQVSNNVSLCMGDKTTLVASGGNTFNWSPPVGLNITSGFGVVANPTSTTIYTVQIGKDLFCSSTLTVMVKVNPKPVVFAGRDSIYNLDELIYLNANGTGTLTWISGSNIVCQNCPVTIVKPLRDECYVIEAENEFGCKVQDKVCIQLTTDIYYYAPNSFSPNNDNLNDVFYLFGNGLNDFKMEIFDRWGSLLFYSTDQSLGWDGKFNGVICKNDSYIYKITFKGLNGKLNLKQGYINLIN